MVVNSHNMKNLFLINEEEKNRILNLHETATKRHYLSEQQTTGYVQLTESDLKKTIKKVFLREDDEALPDMENVPLGKVEAVQQALVDAGYNIGPTGVDGVFGKYTRGAVLKYQKDNGIKQTGNVGPITSKRLGVQQLTSGEPSQPQTTTATTQKKTTIPQTNPNKTKTPETKVSKTKNDFKIKDKELRTTTKDTFGDTYMDTILPKQVDTELKLMAAAEKEMGKMSKKTYQQLQRIKSKGTLKNHSFIVVNKDVALSSLFGPNYKFITNSSITSGRVKDVKPVDSNKLGYPEWRRVSIDYAKKNPTKPESKVINKWVETAKTLPGLIKSDGTVDDSKYAEYTDNKKIKPFKYSYEARKQAGQDITPGGSYKLGTGRIEKGYAASDTTNTFPLINIETGERLPNAVHGYASKQRGDLIKQFAKQDVNTSKELSRAGSGCINVDENFIKNVNKYKPTYVIIIPDNNQLVDVKIVTYDTWSEKLIALGEKCVRSFISLFS